MSSNPRPRNVKQPLGITLIALAIGLAGIWLRKSTPHAPLPSGAGVGASAHSSTSNPPRTSSDASPSRELPANSAAIDRSLADAIASHARDVTVEAGGRVVKLLPDDTEGDRHQRMLVQVVGGGTVLIAHNIDLAKRVKVREGDTITFKGIYIWNDRGGVVHWTHHDPSNRHAPGWIRVSGVTFD